MTFADITKTDGAGRSCRDDRIATAPADTFFRLFGVSVAVAYTAAHFYFTGIRQAVSNFYSDFLASFPSWAAAYTFGRMDMYRGSLSQDWATRWGTYPVWHYGPLEHLITLPLLLAPDLHRAYLAWLWVNYFFLGAIAVLAVRLFSRTSHSAAILLLVVMLNYNPLYEALTQRAIELFELLLVLVAFSLWKSGRTWKAGFVIGLAAMCKFLPCIFLPYFVLKRQWKALFGALAAILTIVVDTELLLGWKHSGILIQLREGSFSRGELNQGLAAAVMQVADWLRIPAPLALTSRLAILIGMIGVCCLFWVAKDSCGTEDLEWGVLLVAMVILPPHNEQYYLIFLLFAYFVMLSRIQAGVRCEAHVPTSRFTVSAIILSFLLVGAPIPFSLLDRFTGMHVFPIYLRARMPFWGTCILGLMTARELLIAARRREPELVAS